MSPLLPSFKDMFRCDYIEKHTTPQVHPKHRTWKVHYRAERVLKSGLSYFLTSQEQVHNFPLYLCTCC